MASIRAELKSLYSHDAMDDQGLEGFEPEDPKCFAINVVALVGSEGEPESDAFDFVACSPRWLVESPDVTTTIRRAERVDGVAILRGFILMDRWEFPALDRRITALCAQIEGPNWETVASLLNRFLSWEYDYRLGHELVVRARQDAGE
jgi:hypothetical protein